MTEIEEAVGRVEALFLQAHDALELAREHVRIAENAEAARVYYEVNAALYAVRGRPDILTTLASERERADRAERENEELTKALTGLTRQGSEFFARVGDRYTANIPACVQDIRDRMQSAQQRAMNFARDKQSAEAALAALKAEALEVVGAFAGLAACGCSFGVDDMDGNHDDENWFQHDGCILTVGHFRAARAFADKLKEQG